MIRIAIKLALIAFFIQLFFVSPAVTNRMKFLLFSIICAFIGFIICVPHLDKDEEIIQADDDESVLQRVESMKKLLLTPYNRRKIFKSTIADILRDSSDSNCMVQQYKSMD